MERRSSPTCARSRRDHALGEFLERARSSARGHLPRRRSWTRAAARRGRTTAPAARRRRSRRRRCKALESPDAHRRSGAGRVLPRACSSDEAAALSGPRRAAAAAADDARLGPRIGPVGHASLDDVLRRRSGARRRCATSSSQLLDAHRRAVATRRPSPSLLPAEIPLTLHARYSRAGDRRRARLRRGRQAEGDPGRNPLGRRRRTATSSSSTSTRPSATTRRRRCTATTRSIASCSTGSPSRGRHREQPTVQRYINHRAARHARAALRARAQDVRARHAAVHVPRAGRATSSTAASARWRSPGGCRRRCLRSSSKSPGASRLPSRRYRR